jgi:FixJ family two-component response regulator
MDDDKNTSMHEPHILIVDDDAHLCALLEEILSSWSIKAHSLADPEMVPEAVHKTFYDLILLDVVMPTVSGLELLAELGPSCPETKIILMTGYADKETAIKALRLGAFDVLEKPIAMDLLSHTIRRALHLQAIERAHQEVLNQLRRSQETLLARQTQLEQVNSELMDTSKALSILAQHIEKTRKETKTQVIQKVRSFILPIVDTLRRDKFVQERYEPQLTILVGYIEELTSGLATDFQISMSLSFSELRVACLINQGMTTEDIATHLHISPDTVKTHRRNIRRKLKIVGSKGDLRTHLQSLEGAGALAFQSNDA